MLIILGGLPGAGKTTLARAIAAAVDAAHVRIDAIEQELRASGTTPSDVGDAGYRLAYALAEEHLRAGRPVVADAVNALEITRDAWRRVSVGAGVARIEIEVLCSDAGEHRRRVESRFADIDGFILPTWDEVRNRHYEPWTQSHFVIDTAGERPEISAARAIAIVRLARDP